MEKPFKILLILQRQRSEADKLNCDHKPSPYRDRRELVEEAVLCEVSQKAVRPDAHDLSESGGHYTLTKKPDPKALKTL